MILIEYNDIWSLGINPLLRLFSTLMTRQNDRYFVEDISVQIHFLGSNCIEIYMFPLMSK